MIARAVLAGFLLLCVSTSTGEPIKVAVFEQQAACALVARMLTAAAAEETGSYTFFCKEEKPGA